ncbi:DUF3826 domain-containing protein [Arcticibacter tournemirensis]|uniref:DUF3826 domain-containing protein n=1 Tax=Arcticibacter tournemirensis TaxID=699437 RepID=A0A4V1KIL0_9SPHI|nr:DUF3826 domain-containing protein [Arcticibacter tournemirensis]RXF71062.1 DUF3826 domain-containing protein [Arcticibacter tournemirensis]
MNQWVKVVSLCFIMTIGLFVGLKAQEQKKEEDKAAEYTRAITQRADKIVVTLNLADQAKANKVRDIITQQYRDLNTIQEAKKEKVNNLKEKTGDDKQSFEAKVKDLETADEKQIAKLHKRYISRLSKELNAEQVDKVKDGMTYNVLPITYKGYLEMLPDLTEKQKSQILAYLTEAREHAIDAGSSEKKHWWFGKYKGKINNYLSTEGVETKTARAEWEKKLKEREAAKP